MSRLELLKLLFIKYEELKDTSEYWFYQEESISAMLRPQGKHYYGFIIYHRTLYHFIFHPGKTEFIQVAVRKNNVYMKISGINAMKAITYIHNLPYLELITMTGSVRSNTEFWAELFKNY